MDFEENQEQAAKLLVQVRELADKHNIPLHPVNYTVLYLYASGRLPELNKDLDQVLADRDTLTPEKSLELYRTYYFDDIMEASNKASMGVQSILDEVINGIREMAGSNRQFGEALESALGTFESKPDSIADLVKSLAQVTQSSISRNEHFQNTLESASSEVQQLRADLEKSQRQAMSDPLTGLLNRRAFDVRLEDMLSRGRAGVPIALMVIDIDHFKKFNDTYGHSVGDRVLQAVAKILRDNTAAEGTVARYGGEEFVVLLNDCDKSRVEKISGEYQHVLSRLRLKQKQTGRTIDQITMSIGVAIADVEDEPDAFFDRADAALYQAKAAGRNRVVFAEPACSDT